jgi:signal transduction histidine kinase
MLSIVILLVFLIYRAYKLNQFIHDLNDSCTYDDFPLNSDSSKDKLVFSTISEIHLSYQNKLETLRQKLTGRNTLFTSFIHNMKSSTAVIELATSSPTDIIISDIMLENEKLKSNLEQALNVLRLDEFANDYVPECIDLYELVSTVINEKRRDFIYSRVFPVLLDKRANVYTDKKWCGYMIEQVISNAIKYSEPGSKVYFEIEIKEKHATLNIRDEGIGIPPEDLPRVFDLFYTGQNGRNTKNGATGIGLAMVKHIAKQLGHEVTLLSKKGKGTCVCFTYLTKV